MNSYARSPRNFRFTLEHRSARGPSRAGFFETAHGRVETPVFMPVATHAALRGHLTESIEALDFHIILGNTYHLLLRPGPDVFRQFGGIHRFMQWPRSVLTDSGGFQIFSLSRQLRMSEEGADFRSYVDGKRIVLTPEVSIATQRSINSDIMMVLDQCVPSMSDRGPTEAAMHLTHRWAKRSFEARGDSPQALFGIVQGGRFEDLRRISARQITDIPFDGYALGGLAVGEEKSVREEIIELTAELLPVDRPRYLMGVGTPLDILESVARGVDMFDCILPTAHAQQGICFTARGKMNLTRGVHARSFDPIDAECGCHTCRTHSRAYLHHLTKAGESLADTLIGQHNLYFYRALMREIRGHILGDTFESYYAEKRVLLAQSDAEHPVTPPIRKVRPNREVLGDYEISRRNGHVSVKQRSSGEVMHSVSDPLDEARRLYVEQSGFLRRIVEEPDRKLVVWDVGLGAATNAMAAILGYEDAASRGERVAPVHLVSFERDLDPLRLAVHNSASFPHLHHHAPTKLLQDGAVRSRQGELLWTLIEGEFLETMDGAPPPDLVFYDPFSYKTDSDLWTLECFRRVRERSSDHGCELFTYSASTSVRAALLAAGFCVARGAGSGPKSDTTIALTPSRVASAGYELLGAEWLERWERSDSRLPLGTEPEDAERVAEVIRGSMQFSRGKN